MHNNANVVECSLTNEKRNRNRLIFSEYRAKMLLLPDNNLVQQKNSVKLMSVKNICLPVNEESKIVANSDFFLR